MINRVILLVIDGLGVGALPDAAEYGDVGANTAVHLAEAAGGLTLPNLETLGLGHLAPIPGVRPMAQPLGCFGRLGFVACGKDSLVGYWETAGVLLRDGTATFASGVPPEIVAVLEQTLGRKVIGNRVAAMGTMLAEYGAEHLSTGAAIVWTDGGATCHVAVHGAAMKAADLFQRCRDARKAITSARAPVRIVAHSLAGEPGSLMSNAGRKDLVSEPATPTMLDALNRSGQIVMGIGKVSDLFNGRGLTKSFPAASADAALDETLGMLGKVPRGLLYVSLELLPEDTTAAATALQEFDRRLPVLFEKLRAGDMLVITADHGRDVTRPAKTATREYVPLLVTGPKLARGVNLGTRATAADVGQTIVDALRAERLPVGDSFYEALRPA